MKHLLNNMTESEKNSIREQHSGGMKVMTKNFAKLLNSKLGDSKPLVAEQEQPKQGVDNNWNTIKKGLMSTNPKVISFKNPQTNLPTQSLNWGNHKNSGANWGLSIISDDGINLAFTTKDEIQYKIFLNTMKQYGIEVKGNTPSGITKDWSGSGIVIGNLGPQKIFSLTTQLINSLTTSVVK